MISLYSLIWTVLVSCPLLLLIVVLRRRTACLMKYGVTFICILYAFCAIRMLIPIEVPVFQKVICDPYVYSHLMRDYALLDKVVKYKIVAIIIISWIVGSIIATVYYSSKIIKSFIQLQKTCYEGDGRAERILKEIDPDMNVVTDVCMCEYTSHGHCGILTEGGYVDNDKTLEHLAQIAVSHVKAGADMVAPSDMMDGRVKAIREALDKAGFVHIPIMSYSVKYASTFYGPFREAANSAPSFGDRKAYQMDPANTNEALIEAELDVLEGADILMVKPALSYLDVIRRVKDNYNLPLAAYNVSGEYAMLKSAVKNGILSEGAIYESILSIKRAGADIIITYFAKDLAKMIRDNK